MHNSLEKFGESLFPEKFRHYLTFRLMTVVVVVLMSVNYALNVFNELEPSSEISRRVNRMRSVAHSPALLILTNVVLALGFWLVLATKEKKQYYWLRVIFYGMLLAAVLGEIISFLVPIHRP
jgi:uncharacterized BrkB/YihY/UPF0761 family membrane protein